MVNLAYITWNKTNLLNFNRAYSIVLKGTKVNLFNLQKKQIKNNTVKRNEGEIPGTECTSTYFIGSEINTRMRV